MIDWGPIWLTAKLAGITTLLLLLISMPLAYWLAFSKFRAKSLVEALVNMPLVLPPTVLGFYILVAFSPAKPFGNWLDTYLGIQLVFSFEGLVLGSVIYSLPFMVQPLQSGFKGVESNLIEAAKTMGKGTSSIVWRVLLPNMRPAILTGIVLAFAHTVGEFGVVLMIGGNIPGVSRVASIAIYDEVESLNYATAHVYSAILFASTFVILVSVYWYNSNRTQRSW